MASITVVTEQFDYFLGSSFVIHFDDAFAAQRLALLAGGRAWPRLIMRKNAQVQKLLENAQTPTSQVHALLGNLTERKTRQLIKTNNIIPVLLGLQPLQINLSNDFRQFVPNKPLKAKSNAIVYREIQA
jgi:hypothetical protein